MSKGMCNCLEDHPLVKQLLTPEVLDALEAVMRDGATKHPDIEDNKPVDLPHEWRKAVKHASQYMDYYRTADPDSGQNPLAHSAMRILKMLRATLNTGGQ
jgi:hypothetical protein